MKHCCDEFKDAIKDDYIWEDERWGGYEFGNQGYQSAYHTEGREIHYCPFCGKKLETGK